MSEASILFVVAAVAVIAVALLRRARGKPGRKMDRGMPSHYDDDRAGDGGD